MRCTAHGGTAQTARLTRPSCCTRFEIVAHPAFNTDATECEMTVRVLPAAAVEGAPAGWLEFRFRLRCVDGGAFKGCWMTKHVEAPWFSHNYQ